MSRLTAWIIAILITLIIGAISAHSGTHTSSANTALQTNAESRRDIGAAKACDGQPFAWDGPVLVCYREVKE